MTASARSILIILLLMCGPVFAQEDIPAKHAAYFRCINNIETKPRDAFQYGSEYLNKYPNDDPRLVQFARSFTSAFEKIDSYLDSVTAGDFSDGAAW